MTEKGVLMKRGVMLVALLVAILYSCTFGAVDSSFIFGIWTYGTPEQAGTNFDSLLTVWHDTLHFNTVHGQCYTQTYLNQYKNHGFRIIIENDNARPNTLNVGHNNPSYYPLLYGDAVYNFWEAEGSYLGACDLLFDSYGVLNVSGQDTSIYFAMSLEIQPYVIMTGPWDSCPRVWNDFSAYSKNLPRWGEPTWYSSHPDTNSFLQYEARLRLKVGNDLTPTINDTVLVFYVQRYEIPSAQDTIIVQQPLVLMDTDFGRYSTSFQYKSPLAYWFNVKNDADTSVVAGVSNRGIKGINWKVKWYGKRDVYFDKIKVSDVRGRELWEVQASNNMTYGDSVVLNYVDNVFFNDPAVLGYYIRDDQGFSWDRDNMWSLRRVDSLISTHAGIGSQKHGFLSPHADVDGIDWTAKVAYSTFMMQIYPIQSRYRTSSEAPYETSIQRAWEGGLVESLAKPAQTFRDRGLPYYALLQGFSGGPWRWPTAEEHLCMVNMVLAYGVDGIVYWKYPCSSYPGFVSGPAEQGTPTPVWHQVDTLIGPYIEKMGPIFAGLEWKHAWEWGFQPSPSNTRIYDIGSNEYSPASTYLQVAEFALPGTTDWPRYYFLVNRRCLPTESVTGHVWFLGSYYPDSAFYVTDMLSDSTSRCYPVHIASSSHPRGWNLWGWNFSIPPGAGRLYRISLRVPCKPGDANGDGSIDISDAIYIIGYIFGSGPAPVPYLAGDANCDGSVDITDAVFLISYIFSGGAAPCAGCY